MENKYYTPTIDEFFCGFECEIKGKNESNWSKLVLGKDAIWHLFTNLEYLDQATEQIRVKHLYREDVEECGWKFKEIENGLLSDRPIFKYKNYSLNYCKNEHGIWILIIDEDVDYQHFSGQVKNKSELKKLMQMLNIK